MGKCLICERIKSIKNNTNPYFVVEMETGYVVLEDYQFYKGYTLFLSKKHTNELHYLDEKLRLKFLEEMSIVGEAVFKAFHPKKLNYEALGNSDPHLHWHIIPRYKNDPNIKSPIWITDKSIRCSDEFKPGEEKLKKLKQKILTEMNLMKKSQ